MRSVCGAECVVYIYFCQRSELFCEFGIVLFFFGVESDVFKEHDIAGLERCSLCLRVLADNILCHDDVFAEKFGNSCGNRSESKLLDVLLCLFDKLCGSSVSFIFGKSLDLCLFFLIQLDLIVENIVGFAHMRAENNGSAVVEKIFDGGKCAYDTLIAGDYTVLHRYVEVASYKDLFTGNFDVGN